MPASRSGARAARVIGSLSPVDPVNCVWAPGAWSQRTDKVFHKADAAGMDYMVMPAGKQLPGPKIPATTRGPEPERQSRSTSTSHVDPALAGGAKGGLMIRQRASAKTVISDESCCSDGVATSWPSAFA